MGGFYICAFLSIAGIGGVFGVTEVNLTLSNPAPEENSRVDMKCVFPTDPQVKFVYIDRFKSQHLGWRTIAKFNLINNTQAFEGEGTDLESRAELSVANGSVTLTYNTIGCDDTSRYKCDLTMLNVEHDHNYHMNDEELMVKDSAGETCGGPLSCAVSLPVLLIVLFVSVLLR